MAAKRFKLHPVCKMFPKYTADQRAAIMADVKERGRIITPLIVHEKDDHILVYDGQNRLSIGEELGIEIPWEEYQGTEEEAVAYAKSLNIARRDLTPSQRAMIGVKIEGLKLKMLRKRKKEAQDRGQQPAPEDAAASDPQGDLAEYLSVTYGFSRPLAFKAMSLEERSAKVKQYDLTNKVVDGEMSLPDAYNELLRLEAVEAAKERPSDQVSSGSGGDTYRLTDGDDEDDDKEEKEKTDETPAAAKEPEDEPIVDGLGNPVPKKMRVAFSLRPAFMDLVDKIREVKKDAKNTIVDKEGSKSFDIKEFEKAVESVAKYVKDTAPYAPCLKCRARPNGCDECGAMCYVNKLVYEMQRERKAARDAKKAEKDQGE